jgi:hypothetical protein
MDIFVLLPFSDIGFKCLDGINNETPLSILEDLRSMLMLIASGLNQQRRSSYLAEVLFRVFRGRMRPQEVLLLRESVDLDKQEGQERRTLMQAVRSNWPVGVTRKTKNVDELVLSHLVEKYAGMNVDGGPAFVDDHVKGSAYEPVEPQVSS